MLKCQVSCPECGQRLSAPAGHTGRIGCLACKHKFDIVDGEVEIKQVGEVAKTALIGGLKGLIFFGNSIQTMLTIVAIVGVIVFLYGALTSNVSLLFLGTITAVGALTLKNPWF
jgi:hypothetical protein